MATSISKTTNAHNITLRDASTPILSVVVPVFNEQANINAFTKRTRNVLDDPANELGGNYELLFVDDGSTDQTLAGLQQARQHDQRIKIIQLSRNFGQDAAPNAGLNHACGEAVCVIDIDLQDPPELISAMLKRWRDGAWVVHTVRSNRDEDGWLKKTTAEAFYRIRNQLAERPIPRQSSDFRLLDRRAVRTINSMPERVRFMKELYAWVGFPTASIEYERAGRNAGHSKWGLLKLWSYALDGITNATTLPLRIWTYIGGSVALIAFFYALIIVFNTLVFGRETPGYTSLMAVILIIGDLNLIALGIIGEYLGRIFKEVKGRPAYIVQATQGLGTNDC